MRPLPASLGLGAPLGRVLIGVLAFASLAGCHEEEVGYTEVKRLDEVLTPGDIADLMTVLKTIDEQDRKRLPTPFVPPPRWSDDRTLPVRELLDEERLAAGQAWDPDESAAALPATPVWEKALRARKLTPAQFASLVLSVAAAAGRFESDQRLDLPRLVGRGAKELASLAAEERTFASLPAEERYATLRRAAWLTTAERAGRLALVPPENVELIATRREELRGLLPDLFFRDPFEGLYPRSEDFGVPFEEGIVSDADLVWSPDHALLGTDVPDAVTADGGATGRH